MWNSSESTDQWSFNHQPIHTALGKHGSDYASYLIKMFFSSNTWKLTICIIILTMSETRPINTLFFFLFDVINDVVSLLTLFFFLFDVINDVVSLSVTVNSLSPPVPLVLHEFGPNNKIANTIWCLSHPGARLHVCAPHWKVVWIQSDRSLITDTTQITVISPMLLSLLKFSGSFPL